MLDTSTSPAPASEATRAPVCTAIPRTWSPAQLALARVQARAHLEPDALHVVDDRARAADRAGRPVEGREEAVARGVDLTPSEAFQISADDLVVTVEQIAPASVSELARPLGRADDVREEHRREHPVRLRRLAHAGQKLLDLVEDVVRRRSREDDRRPGSST